MKLIAAIIIMSMLGAAAYFIFEAGVDSEKEKVAKAISEATNKARKEEQEKQEKINNVIQKQYDEVAGINATLNDDLSKLRNRANRRNLSKDSKIICKGSTGRELSSSDAGFLTREAARAEKLRSAITACYSYADSIAE